MFVSPCQEEFSAATFVTVLTVATVLKQLVGAIMRAVTRLAFNRPFSQKSILSMVLATHAWCGSMHTMCGARGRPLRS